MFSNEKLFEIALNLQEPWFVKRIEFDAPAGELHMYIDFRKGSRFPCPVCRQGAKVHDTTDQTWRHLNFFQYKAFIHSRTPRSKCPADGVHLVNVPWSRPGSEFTLLFEALVLAMIAQMPVSAVARIVDEHDTRLWRILHHYVDEARAADDHSQVRNIAIDETACQRGQRYISLSYDTDARRMLFATPGREAFTIGCIAKDLKVHGGKPEQIENVACDMSKAFLHGIGVHFPHAAVAIDKFHLMQLMNEALDEVRRQEQQDVADLKYSRYVSLKNRPNLTAAQARLFEDLSRRNLKTARAYRLHDGRLNNWWPYIIDIDRFTGKSITRTITGFPSPPRNISAAAVGGEYGTETTEPHDWGAFFVNDHGFRCAATIDDSISIAGKKSVRCDIFSDVDPVHLYYPRTQEACWDFGGISEIQISIRHEGLAGTGFRGANSVIRLCTGPGDKLILTPSKNCLTGRAKNGWYQIHTPLRGGRGWRLTSVGRPDPSRINYLEVVLRTNKHMYKTNGTANSGYTVWLDGLKLAR